MPSIYLCKPRMFNTIHKDLKTIFSQRKYIRFVLHQCKRSDEKKGALDRVW